MPESHGPRTYEPFDPDYLRDLLTEVADPIFKTYFRPRLIGARNLPEDGPVILAPNHSGNAFPFDGMVFDALLWQKSGMKPETKLRSVFEKELAVTWWMRPWGIDNFWRRGGGIDITFDNFDRLLTRGERLIYYPEGVPGIGKGFGKRYQLQRYSTSFVIMAARHRVPVVPVHIVNAEWVIPFCYTWKPLDWLMQKVFRVPFLPLPAAPLALLFPWMWYLALPARMVFVLGEPIDMAARAKKHGIRDLHDLDSEDRRKVRALADELRQEVQVELTRCVRRYGKAPYHFRSLGRELWRRRGQWNRLLPWGWAPAFVRFHRDRQRPPARNWLHRLLRDWDLIGFYLPLGWLLLSLFRSLRRPPYGYRGLGQRQRREREGAFHWHLRDRPLPPKQLERRKSVAG